MDGFILALTHTKLFPLIYSSSSSCSHMGCWKWKCRAWLLTVVMFDRLRKSLYSLCIRCVFCLTSTFCYGAARETLHSLWTNSCQIRCSKMSARTHTRTQPCICSDALSNQASGPQQTLLVCHQVTPNNPVSCSYILNRVLNNSALSLPKTMTQLNQSASMDKGQDCIVLVHKQPVCSESHMRVETLASA